MNKKNVIATILSASLFTVVYAQATYPDFNAIDSDGDGNISDEEMRSYSIIKGLKFDFDSADTDYNGYITRLEYEAAIEKAE